MCASVLGVIIHDTGCHECSQLSTLKTLPQHSCIMHDNICVLYLLRRVSCCEGQYGWHNVCDQPGTFPALVSANRSFELSALILGTSIVRQTPSCSPAITFFFHSVHTFQEKCNLFHLQSHKCSFQ